MGPNPKRRCVTVDQAFDMEASLDGKPYGRSVNTSVQTTRIMPDHTRNSIQTSTLCQHHDRTGQVPFPFFDLPQEIRDLIYSHLVVYTSSESEPVFRASTVLKNRQKRLTAKASRERINRQRSASGARLIQRRPKASEPYLHLNLLSASRRMYAEASDYLYSKNCFHITLSKLPSITFDAPYGWDFSRIKKLQLDVQIKDAIRMDRYVDWRTFFSTLPSLQSLRIEPTFHQRYYEWAYPELYDWSTAHYVHKAFFRELLTAIPYHVNLKIGASSNPIAERQSRIGNKFLFDMYVEFGCSMDRAGHRLPATSVVDYSRDRISDPPHLRTMTMTLGPDCPQTKVQA